MLPPSIKRSWGSSVGITTRLLSGLPRVLDSIPSRGKRLSFLHNVQTRCWPHVNSVSSPNIKRLGCEVGHLPSFTAEIKARISAYFRPSNSSHSYSPTSERTALVRSQVGSYGICDGESDIRAGFLRVFRFPLLILIPPTAQHSSSSSSSSSLIRGWYNKIICGLLIKWTISLRPNKLK
jgi:hypothetical protein